MSAKIPIITTVAMLIMVVLKPRAKSIDFKNITSATPRPAPIIVNKNLNIVVTIFLFLLIPFTPYLKMASSTIFTIFFS